MKAISSDFSSCSCRLLARGLYLYSVYGMRVRRFGRRYNSPLLRSLLPLMSQYCARQFKLSRYVSLGLFFLPTVPTVGRRIRLPGIWTLKDTHLDAYLVTYFDIDYSVHFFDQRHRKICLQVFQQQRGLRNFLRMINVCLDLSFLSCFFAS